MTSPFTSKLGTNYCPTDKEMVEIEALLIEPGHRMKRLDEEIVEMQKALDKLTEERDSLGAYIGAHKALVSPVRRLPLDIIQEIFVACLPTHRNCVMSAREAPVLLGRICSAWRAISFSTPRLWASLHIADPGSSKADKSEQRLEVTRTWLQRSDQCPLSISLHSPGPDSILHNPPSPTAAFLQVLIPFASRWQHIRFEIWIGFFETLGQLSASDVPMLQSFALNQVRGHEQSVFEWDRLVMLSGPSIYSLSISGSGAFLERLPVRWAHLTALSTLGMEDLHISSTTALWAITQCPNLQTFSLVLYDYNDNGPTAEPMIEHNVLQTLDCRSSLVTCMRRLLGRLLLPELRQFRCLQGRNRGHPAAQAHEVEPLVRFLTFSSHLESIHLGTGQVSSPSSIQEIIRSLPRTIQRLHLDVISYTAHWGGVPPPSCFNDDVLATISPMPGGLLSLPVLRDFQIDHCTVVSDAALLEFITASAPTLKHIRVDFSREIELDIRPDLQPFIDSGLDVSITHSPPFPHVSPWSGLPDAPAPYLPPLTPSPF